MPPGFTVWFTGLSGAGKSTLSRPLAALLRGRGRAVELLDGDEVRETLTRGLGFSRQDRDENVRRIGFVARLLSRSGVVAITAAISPYRQARDQQRRAITGDGAGFVEVYLRCPLEVVAARDVKGLYARALRGEIENFTGVSDPYEEPLSPEVVIDTDRESVDEGLARIVAHLEQAGLLP